MTREEKAEALFNQGSGINCSQAIMSVYAQEIGIDETVLQAMTSGFAGGFMEGSMCGAVSASLMVIGLYYKDNQEQSRETCERFKRRFEERHGHLDCRDLLGFRINDPIERVAISEQELFKYRCPNYIREAVAILEELLIFPIDTNRNKYKNHTK